MLGVPKNNLVCTGLFVNVLESIALLLKILKVNNHIQLLKQATIPQIFDAILIDEGQDLIVDRYKFKDKQPFYWLAYQALRSPNPIHSKYGKCGNPVSLDLGGNTTLHF